MRPLGWLFPVGTSAWRLDFIATVHYQSQQCQRAQSLHRLGKGQQSVLSVGLARPVPGDAGCPLG